MWDAVKSFRVVGQNHGKKIDFGILGMASYERAMKDVIQYRLGRTDWKGACVELSVNVHGSNFEVAKKNIDWSTYRWARLLNSSSMMRANSVSA